MGDLLFSQSLLQQIDLHAQIGIDAFQGTVLVFHRLHLADQGRIHPAILGPPFVKLRIAHAMFAA